MTNYSKRYSEYFKNQLVTIYNTEHCSMFSISMEYGVTVSTISKLIKNCQVVEAEDGPITVQDFKNYRKN